MPKKEHIDTAYQGRYAYRASVEHTGTDWEWEVDRLPTFLGELVRITAVEEGRATSRAAAVAAAQAARGTMMERSRHLDIKGA